MHLWATVIQEPAERLAFNVFIYWTYHCQERNVSFNSAQAKAEALMQLVYDHLTSLVTLRLFCLNISVTCSSHQC